jgi:methylmalonyl-CoA/ethylmalonyl-CoA epimerase
MILDHVGYAVADIARYLESFLVPLFQPRHVTEVVEDPVQKVRVVFATLADGTRLELIEPVGADSPAYRRLQEKRSGLYHTCYRVDDLEGALAEFQQRRCLCVSPPAPAPAFVGRRIAFVYTPYSDLIELVEKEVRA